MSDATEPGGRRGGPTTALIARVLLLTGLAVGAWMWLGGWPALTLTCAAWILMPQLGARVER